MDRRHLIAAGVAAMLAAALSGCTPYRSNTGRATAYSPAGATTADVLADAVFSTLERREIRDYYRGNLPPGLQRQLARNGRLPPGLQKRALPPDLIARLPQRDSRLDRVLVGADVLLVEIATGVILDIIQDVDR